VETILICYPCKFGEYIGYSSRDIEFFLGVYFFGMPCISGFKIIKYGVILTYNGEK